MGLRLNRSQKSPRRGPYNRHYSFFLFYVVLKGIRVGGSLCRVLCYKGRPPSFRVLGDPDLGDLPMHNKEPDRLALVRAEASMLRRLRA